MIEIHEGPYPEKPDFDPPPSPDASNTPFPHWIQVRSGEWYACYSRVVGPGDRDYHVEHRNDPNCWNTDRNSGWACRHGWMIERKACRFCGSKPNEISDEQIQQARLQVAHLLDGII